MRFVIYILIVVATLIYGLISFKRSENALSDRRFIEANIKRKEKEEEGIEGWVTCDRTTYNKAIAVTNMQNKIGNRRGLKSDFDQLMSANRRNSGHMSPTSGRVSPRYSRSPRNRKS